MNDITALALVAKIKKQTESFDTVVLKEVEAKALVEALEKAQQRIDELEGSLGVLEEVYISAADEVSELESRTVTVKLPAEYLNADGSVNADMANTCPVVSAYREALRAAGIQVIEGEG